jgi:hypothetical protein
MSGKVGKLGLAFLAIFIFGNFYLQLTSAPARTQSARLDSLGEFTAHLQTQPDPPKTGGIPLILHFTDANGKYVEVDKVVYEYEFQDRGSRKQEGERVSDGIFQTTAGLDNVGDWYVVVTLYKGTQQTQVSFTLRVMPNI